MNFDGKPGGQGGGDSSSVDTDSPPTNCWPEAPLGGRGGGWEGRGGLGGEGGGGWEGRRVGGLGGATGGGVGGFCGGWGGLGTSEQFGMRPRCDPTVHATPDPKGTSRGVGS